MVNQQIVFTVMPRGISRDADPWPVSVYVAPRLFGADALGAFPDWLAWTQRLIDQPLSLEFTTPGGPIVLPIDTSGLRPDLWAAMFNDQTYVRSHTFDDYSGAAVLSWPERYALSMVKGIYAQAGVELALPDRNRYDSREDSAHHRRLVRELVHGLTVNWDDRRAEEHRAFERDYSRAANPIFPMSYAPDAIGADGLLTLPGTPTEADRVRRERMMGMFAVVNHVPPGKPLDDPPDLDRLIDFHQALSALNSYPELLRDLGLVLDFQLPGGRLDLGGAATGTISVTAVVNADWQLADTAVPPALPTLATRYFLASAGGSTLFGVPPAGFGGPDSQLETLLGLLNLHPARYGLAQVDVDGALHKLIMLAKAWEEGAPPASSTHPEVFDETATIPALRSGGLSLYADGRARKLAARLKKSKELNDALSGAAVDPLDADHLIHGYRIDVWDSRTGDWHSLHRRDAEFTIGDQTRIVPDREGFTELAATQAGADPGQPQPDDLYLHESIARWTGWSLSVPPAGLHLSSDPDPAKALPNAGENEPATPFPMTTAFHVVPGSLPSLRFGRRYRFRVRVTDLCGNSLELDDPLAGEASTGGLSMPVDPDGFAYLRYEPVAAPLLVARDAAVMTGPGSSLHRLVIRTFNADPSLDVAPADLTAGDRHLVPPRATVDLAEKLTMFDDAAGKLDGSATMYALIATRDAGQLATETAEVDGQQQTYPLEPAESLAEVPFLPDVLARGIALRDLPGTADGTIGRVSADGELGYALLDDPSPRPGSATLVAFGDGTDWQQLRPLRLALTDTNAGTTPRWDDATRTLSVPMPKGESLVVPLSSYLWPGDLALMGVWQWIREYIDARAYREPETDVLTATPADDVDKIAHVLQRTVEGGHWMLTPPTVLTLVHAVQQPIGTPEFTAIAVQHRTYGQTDQLPKDETRFPDPSVLQTVPEKAPTEATELDPITAWRRPGAVDAYLLGGLRVHPASTEKIDLTASWTDPVDDPNLREPTEVQHSGAVDEVPIRDRREGVIWLREASPATKRRVGWFDPDHDLLCFVRAGDVLGNVLSGTPAMDADAAPRHHLNDTLHHRVTYTATAASRFAEYFTADREGGFTRTSQPAVVHVPASSRPQAPQVSYVVPTFGWQRQSETNVKRSVRFGGGLRIYLERGWYSSGAGELLGISLYSLANGQKVDYEAWKPYVTEWGSDPIWKSERLPTQTPGLSSFPDAVATEQMVPLDAPGQPLADVAGYPVQFDAERGLWFADVTVTTDALAYAPFVRLALCRYQPYALPEAKISRVVTADFAQLTPGRAAVISADPYHPRRLRVTVSGITPDGPAPVVVDDQPPDPVATPTAITIVVQERRDDLAGELGWIDVADGVASVADRTATVDHPPDLLIWNGTVDFAEVPAPGRYRLLICEYEYYSANHLLVDFDGRTGDLRTVAPRRLVYAETVEVDSSLVSGPPTSLGTSV